MQNGIAHWWRSFGSCVPGIGSNQENTIFILGKLQSGSSLGESHHPKEKGKGKKQRTNTYTKKQHAWKPLKDLSGRFDHGFCSYCIVQHEGLVGLRTTTSLRSCIDSGHWSTADYDAVLSYM